MWFHVYSITRSKADFSLALRRWTFLCIHSNGKYLYFKSVYPPALPLSCISKVCIHLCCKFVLQKCVFTCVFTCNRIHQIFKVLLSEYASTFPLGIRVCIPLRACGPLENTHSNPLGKSIGIFTSKTLNICSLYSWTQVDLMKRINMLNILFGILI